MNQVISAVRLAGGPLYLIQPCCIASLD